jgi:hypothetical protein
MVIFVSVLYSAIRSSIISVFTADPAGIRRESTMFYDKARPL